MKTRPLINRSLGMAMTASLLMSSAPVAFAQDDTVRLKVVLDTEIEAAGDLSVAERLALLNLILGEDALKCGNIESDNCERRVIQRSVRVVSDGADDDEKNRVTRARDLLAAWADANPKRVSWAEDQTEKRKEKRAAAAAAAGNGGDDAAQTETETVTKETTRASNQDKAEQGSDNNDKLLKALGIAGAALVAGSLLENGDEIVEQQGDRLVVRRDGELVVRKDENELLRRPGSEVQTRTFSDGSTRTTVTKPNGNKIVTIRDGDGNTIRRTRVLESGREVVLFDDTQGDEDIDLSALPEPASEKARVDYSRADLNDLRRALRREEALAEDQRYSLRQVRNNRKIRELVPQIDLDGINFASGSAAIAPNEARDLLELGTLIRDMIKENPDEVFLIEGHTDAVGSDIYNIALSDRRAESVALALTEYFDVPPENLVVQGYGERFLKIKTEGDERANRRATVRRITPLLKRG